MIIWSGWGILGFILLVAGGGGGTAVGTALGGSADNVNLGTAGGLVLAAVAIWLVGQRLNRPVEGYHPQTGQPVYFRNQHRLFWIPVQYISVVAVLGAIGTAVVAVTS